MTVIAPPRGQVNISPELNALGISGDVALDIVVTVPKGHIHASALYWQGGQRAVIKTHQE